MTERLCTALFLAALIFGGYLLWSAATMVETAAIRDAFGHLLDWREK